MRESGKGAATPSSTLGICSCRSKKNSERKIGNEKFLDPCIVHMEAKVRNFDKNEFS